MERLAFVFATAWDLYQVEHSLTDLEYPAHQPTEQMNYLKKLWTALNTDITPHLQTLRDNILDLYDPQLVPVHSGGMTIEWVSRRTGERLWS